MYNYKHENITTDPVQRTVHVVTWAKVLKPSQTYSKAVVQWHCLSGYLMGKALTQGFMRVSG